MLAAGPSTQAATAAGSDSPQKQQTAASEPSLQHLILGVKCHPQGFPSPFCKGGTIPAHSQRKVNTIHRAACGTLERLSLETEGGPLTGARKPSQNERGKMGSDPPMPSELWLNILNIFVLMDLLAFWPFGGLAAFNSALSLQPRFFTLLERS